MATKRSVRNDVFFGLELMVMTEVATAYYEDQDFSPARFKSDEVDVTVLIPAHNEEGTIEGCLRRAEKALSSTSLRYEIIVIDDGSTDRTSEYAHSVGGNGGSLEILRNEEKNGKGAALIAGMRRARGDIIVVLDADLEYAPEEIPQVIRPIEEGSCDIVFGSRFLGQTDGMSLSHKLGNIILTETANLLYNASLTDIMTGYKALRRATLRTFDIGESGFGFEVELAAKALKSGFKVSEVPITYRRRRMGKSKIRWTDGIRCLKNLVALTKNRSPA